MPIRYVSAVILVVAIFGLASAGVDEVATTNSQEQIDNEITELEERAVTLYEQDELPPQGLEGPRRQVTFELPEDSLTTDGVEYLEFRETAENATVVEYRLEGGAKHQQQIAVPVAPSNSSSLRITGDGTNYEFLLTLERDENGDRVVNLSQ